MENQNKLEKYTNAVYQNTKTAIQAISDILSKVKSPTLKIELLREQTAYNKLSKECEMFATKNKINSIKDNNCFEKAKLCMSIGASTMFDKSTRKIAELMLFGTFMGVVTCEKDKFDHFGTSKELDEILEKLMNVERENIDKLLPFLNKNETI